MTQVYDIAIIGSGISGSFAALKIAHSYKGLKTLVIEAGASARKRRTQMMGYLGLLPNSDGKLYMPDLDVVEAKTTKGKTKNAFDWFQKNTDGVINFNVIKDKPLLSATDKKIRRQGFEIQENNYIQLLPAEIHSLSKFISDQVLAKDNITSINNIEVSSISKERGNFIIQADEETYRCKRLLLAIGRSGWRQAGVIFKDFDIIENNDWAEIGIRVEIAETSMRDFNHSNCSIIKENMSLGPFSWSGTVIPEDHYDMVISSFRGNESRWHSNKVSFNLLGRRKFEGEACEQMSRIGQLTFILTNDRVARERISTLLAKKSKLSIIPEYEWLNSAVEEISEFIPELQSKGYFHFPTLMPLAPQIKVGKNLSTEMEGLFVAGETARLPGILGAITSGIIAGESLCK